jgi:hypothetical protein
MTGWYANNNGAQRWRVLHHYTERVQHYLDMLQQMDIIGRTRCAPRRQSFECQRAGAV